MSVWLAEWVFNRKQLIGFQLHMLRSEQHSFKVLQIREQYLTENSNNCFFFGRESYFILKHEPARRYRQRIHDVSSSCFQAADQIFPYLCRKQINYVSFCVSLPVFPARVHNKCINNIQVRH